MTVFKPFVSDLNVLIDLFFESVHHRKSDGGGGGNRTHVRRIISKADYVCSFELSSQSEDYLRYVNLEVLGDF